MYAWFKINDEWKICEIGTPCERHFEENPIQTRIIEENDLGTLHAWDDEICGKIVERYFVVPRNPEKTMIFISGRIQTKSGGSFSGTVFVRWVKDTVAGKRWFARTRGSMKLDSDISPNQIIIVPPTFRGCRGYAKGFYSEKRMRWTLMRV